MAQTWIPEVVTGDDIYQTQCLPFFEKGQNPTVFDRIRYLHPDEMMKERHIVVFHDDLLIGNIALQDNPYTQNQWWIKHVSVDPDFQNQGIATAMVEFLFALAATHTQSLKRSSPSKMGQAYLSDVFARAKTRWPNVVVFDCDTY